MLLNREAFQERSTYPPLFDPQTSGGLLFGVSEEQTHACLEDLKETGWLQATVIGTVTGKAETSSTITLAD